VRGGRAAIGAGSALCLVAALAGCDQAEKADKKAIAESRTSAPAITCAEQASATSVPSAFPSDFPMPAGTTVIGLEQRSDGRTIVYAVSNNGVKQVLQDLQKGLPAAGYTPKEGEVEAQDAESNWSGHGLRGRWEIRALPGCDDDTSVTVLVQKQG
jgi:hypothetical protein